MKKLRQIYQSLPVGMLLCAVGGSLDADSFLLHGHVFAGLQTGNLVMLGAGYTQFDFWQIIKYVSALGAFLLGLIVTRLCQDYYDDQKRHHLSLTGSAVITEIILLLTVGFLSNQLSDLIVIGLMSFVGAIQLQMFQQIEGHPFTPLMMMGHIKKVVNFVDKGDRERVITNLFSLASFFLGAVVTGLLIPWLGDKSLIFAIVMLLGILMLGIIHKR